MTDLEKNYRSAPKLKSPQAMDDRVLRASMSAPHVGVRCSVGSGRQRSWLKPSMAFASLCTVVIGVSLALQSGALKQSAPYSLDVSQNLSSQELSMGGELGPISSESATEVVADSGSAATSFAAKAVLAESSSEARQVIQGESEALNTTRFDEAASAELSVLESVSAFKTPMDSANTDAMVPMQLATAELVAADVVVLDTDALGEASEDDAPMEVARLTQNKINKGQVGLVQQMEGKLKRSQNVQSGLATAPRIQAKLLQERVRNKARHSSSYEVNGQENDAPNADEAHQLGVPVSLWLLAQDSQRYTVQLGASATASSLYSLARGLEFPTEIVRLSSTNITWLLLHGSFEQLAHADEMLAIITEQLAERGLISAIENAKVIRFDEIQ